MDVEPDHSIYRAEYVKMQIQKGRVEEARKLNAKREQDQKDFDDQLNWIIMHVIEKMTTNLSLQYEFELDEILSEYERVSHKKRPYSYAMVDYKDAIFQRFGSLGYKCVCVKTWICKIYIP